MRYLSSPADEGVFPRAPPAGPHDIAVRAPLLRDKHAAFLLSSLRALPESFVSLDASRPWICYWSLHALDLLGVRPTDMFPDIVRWLGRCRSPGGGFGGGPGQAPHAATTYAAVLALAVIGTPEAFAAVGREALYRRYLSWRAPGGGFRVQDGGEVDVRGSFTVLAIARLVGIATPALVDGAAAFVAACQTYEGGFGGEPGAEAHGGYTFCALGSLHILDALRLIDVGALGRWLAGRQMALEGGFQGRTNKLVDSCYSFWQGACFEILAAAELQQQQQLGRGGAPGGSAAPPFDRRALQRYVLCCAQQEVGGLRDKPGKRRGEEEAARLPPPLHHPASPPRPPQTSTTRATRSRGCPSHSTAGVAGEGRRWTLRSPSQRRTPSSTCARSAWTRRGRGSAPCRCRSEPAGSLAFRSLVGVS